MKRVFLALALIPLTGCVWDPTNRTNQDNTTPITVTGYASSPGATVILKAVNQNTGVAAPIATTHASTAPSETGAHSLYYWTANINPASNYWSPQTVTVNGVGKQLNGLPASAGRLELTAFADGNGPLPTFSAGAKTCWADHYNSGESAWDSGAACYDGDSTAVFDNSGVGSTAAPAVAGDWHTMHYVDGLVPGVRWEIGYYYVQSMYILGYMCYPTDGLQHKAVIINHGGFGGLDDLSLGYCLAGAQEGWVTAMSAYRGEVAKYYDWLYRPQGQVELCQGEVTDVLRLLDIVRARPDVDSTRVLMWGYSHGACITHKAVERGALVKAAATFSAPTDFYDWYQDCNAPSDCATFYPENQANIARTLGIPSQSFSVTPQQSRIPYDWRSPATTKGDLVARTDVKYLMIHGGSDRLVYPSQACKMAQGMGSVNWHVDVNGAISQMSPPNGAGCEQLSWQPPQNPVPTSSWPASRYLLIYDVATHENILASPAFAAFQGWYQSIFP